MESNLSKNYSSKHNSSALSKVYTFFVACLPFFASYHSGIPGLTVADVLLFVFAVIAFFSKYNKNYYSVKITWLKRGFVFLIIFTLIACLMNFPSSELDVFIRTTRYSFYLICVLFVSKKLINIDLLKKYIKIICFIATIYIILQFVVYKVFKIVIRGYIPFFRLYTEGYQTMDYSKIYESSNMYRPTSIFLEPAHYSRYCILGIIILLFDSKYVYLNQILKAVFFGMGILISTSSQGYLLLFIIAMIFIIFRLGSVKSSELKTIIFLLLLFSPLLIFFALRNETIISTIKRSMSGGISNSNSAMGARLGGFIECLKLGFVQKLIGTGFGNVPNVWCSSAAYWLYGSGIIVFLMYLFFLLQLIIKLPNTERYISLCILLLFFSDDSFYSYMLVLYFSLVLFRNKVDNEVYLK